MDYKEVRTAVLKFNAMFPADKINPVGKKAEVMLEELQTHPKFTAEVATALGFELEDDSAPEPETEPGIEIPEEIKAILPHAKVVSVVWDNEEPEDFADIVLNAIDALDDAVWNALPVETQQWANDEATKRKSEQAKKVAKAPADKKAAIAEAKAKAAAAASKAAPSSAPVTLQIPEEGTLAYLVYDRVKEAAGTGISEEELFAGVVEDCKLAGIPGDPSRPFKMSLAFGTKSGLYRREGETVFYHGVATPAAVEGAPKVGIRAQRKAEKEAEKAAKLAEKEKKKADKLAEKAAKKAEREARKAAKEKGELTPAQIAEKEKKKA